MTTPGGKGLREKGYAAGAALPRKNIVKLLLGKCAPVLGQEKGLLGANHPNNEPIRE